MGWRYRKSINLGGGFKINISKSGIGYSWGFPGYRHTYSANGSQRKTYSIPGTGISYVENIGRKNKDEKLNYNDNSRLITGETKYFYNFNVSDMGKNDEMLKQINKLRIIDIISNICLISVYLIPIGIILKLLIAFKWKLDLSYEMDDINIKKYDCLNGFLSELAKNNKIWQVNSLTRVYNTKYNAGASNNVTRHKVCLNRKLPWYISSNIDVYCMNLKSEKIYFTPDRMLIFKRMGAAGCKTYNNITAEFSTTNFVENEIVPRDAEIIRYTWRYVNKNGGPDRRFNNNRQIPVCKYGEINLKTSDGINIYLECSNHRLIPEMQSEFSAFVNYHKETKNVSGDLICESQISETENDSELILERAKLKNTLKKIVDKQSSSDANSSLFSDIVVNGVEEKTQSIPEIRLDNKNENKTKSNPNVNILTDEESNHYSYSYHSNNFINDMERYENKVGKECAFVPFMQYYPSYNSMTKEQTDWYFYWRTQARKGIYLNTDLSYIFLHIYELLSGYGYKDVGEGYNRMIDLWENYRKEYPKLDGYLFSWLFDYSLIHNIDFVVPNWNDLSLPYSADIKNVLINKHSSEVPLKLHFSMIDSLCDYSLTRSKFYNDGHQLLMNESIPRVVALADAALNKKTGKGILNTYGPQQSKKQNHYIYQGANCANSNKRIEIAVKDYINSPKLRSYINELVRYAENTLRELYNCRGRLRGVELDEDTASLVQAFLKKEYSTQNNESVISKKADVKLDFESIKDLRNQSDAVREALEVTVELPENKELLTDLHAIEELFEQLPLYCRKVIDELQKSNWEILYDYSIQASVEKINELSAKSVACDILVVENDLLILEDDYRDEFDYIYEHIDKFEKAQASEQNVINARFDLTLLTDELKEFLEGLSPAQNEIIYIILLENNIKEEMERIANEEMSMPEILIDEINDIASQYLGNILIDTVEDIAYVLEEYSEILKQAIK